MRSVLRWVPFIFILLGLAVLAEVAVLRDTFVRNYGSSAWDSLHWYGSAVLIIAAFYAQPRRYGVLRRLLFAAMLVLAAGLLREVRQYYDVGPRGFSRHDIKSDLQGAGVGACISLLACWVNGWRIKAGDK